VELEDDLTACHGQGANRFGPGLNEHASAFIESGARGEHVIHEKKVFSLHGCILPESEGIPQVLHALSAVQMGLSFCITRTSKHFQNRAFPPPNDLAGKNLGLIEATIPLPQRMEGHGHDAVEGPPGQAGISPSHG